MSKCEKVPECHVSHVILYTKVKFIMMIKVASYKARVLIGDGEAINILAVRFLLVYTHWIMLYAELKTNW